MVVQMLNHPVPDPQFGMNSPGNQVTTSYPSGLTVSSAGSSTATLSNPVDPWSFTQPTTTSSIGSGSFTNTFNKTALTWTSTTPVGRTSVTQLNSQELPIKATVPNILPVSYSYTPQGWLSEISQGTRNLTTYYQPTGTGLIDHTTDNAGDTTAFTYDSMGRVLTETLADGRVTGYSYDSAGNVLSVTPPSRSPYDFTYTPVDLTSTDTPPSAPSTQYFYDPEKKPTQIIRPDGSTIAFKYDQFQRLSTVTRPEGVTTTTYDVNSRVFSQYTATDSVTFTHNGSLLTLMTWAGDTAGSISRTFTNQLKVGSETVSGAAGSGTTINFGYDAESFAQSVGRYHDHSLAHQCNPDGHQLRSTHGFFHAGQLWGTR